MTTEIQLTKSYVATVDDCDADLAEYKWYANDNKGTPYAYRGEYIGNRKNKHIAMHRAILERVLGRDLASREYVDHIDGNTLNNTRSNIRLATPHQNQMNMKRRSDSTTGFKGVSYVSRPGRRKRYLAQIRVNKKSYCLGYFMTAEEAAEVYRKVADELFGEFARFE